MTDMENMISLKEISKSFASHRILKGIDLDIRKGEFLSLIGPSGAGKTTLLRILAGLTEADNGIIEPSGELKEHPPVLVFQDYQLFPYQTVGQNIAFGLKARNIPRREIKTRVESLASYFGLSGRLRAYPGELSGGEKQRTALARALILEPRLLLLDEPFANLDRNLKGRTAAYLSRIQKELGLTVLSVTHDQAEALMYSDRIGILLEGELKELGDVHSVYYHPGSLKSALFMGAVNPIPESLKSYFGLREEQRAYARAESFELIPSSGGGGIVVSRLFSGSSTVYELDMEGYEFRVTSTDGALNPGDKVDVKLKDFFLLPEEEWNDIRVRPGP